MRPGKAIQNEVSVLIDHQKYFDQRLKKAEIFCRRFDSDIDFKGKRVLDFGCGHGALSIFAVQAGAQEVVGLDVNATLVEAANDQIARRYPSWASRLKIECRDINDFNDTGFDIVISQAAFEHILNPQECLRSVKRAMNDGGLFYLGFGPLYYAPWGDHRLSGAPLQGIFPWAHLCFSREWLVKHYNATHAGKRIASLHDLGLNGLKFKEYVRLFQESGLKIISLKVNQAEHPLAPMINLFRRIPGMSELLTVNVYALLQKRTGI